MFDILSWTCLVTGSFFAVVGGIGIVRLPDFYTRLHGGGITDTLGAGLVLVGLMFQAAKGGVLSAGFEAGPWLVLGKLVMILFFLLVTSPTSCHALASAALTNGLQPELSEKKDEPSR
ncbi:MAG: monovalent cation/H(+) antiporter subunit G [Planctomycetes bacterium]|nr:monovalent cation/H(+) antiporter subunit G [Planctomycetota bacterium]